MSCSYTLEQVGFIDGQLTINNTPIHEACNLVIRPNISIRSIIVLRLKFYHNLNECKRLNRYFLSLPSGVIIAALVKVIGDHLRR